jgi:hypothetical protein
MPKKPKKLACRVCLTNNSESSCVSIFDQIDDIQISEAIQDIANIPVWYFSSNF